MMEIYPYGGVLAYLKYYYLDGIEKQYLMLLDKTRIRYGSGEKRAVIAKSPKSKKEAKDLASMFGVGVNASSEEREITKVRKDIGD